jgi:2-dehydro-3-deoxy-D-gluconate 5-dehydrogenase
VADRPASSSPFDLTGRLAVVTGARRGIGLAMATALAAAGADVIGVSAQLESSGSDVEQAVRASGRSFEALRVDLADRAAVTRLGQDLAARERPVDVLVNNAGTIRRAPAAEHTDEDFDHVLEVDLAAPFVLARSVGGAMLRRGSGKIIFTASLLSFQGGVNVPGYTAAKSAVAGLTKALANEWAGRGVNVNAIAPGYVETDNTEALQADEERRRAILERIPAGRWGRPGDLEGATVFLASPAADYVHGIVLPVDGGWLAR